MERQIRKNPVDLTDLAIGIIVLGIAVSIGAVILISVRDSTLTSLDTVSVSNESTATVNETGVTLSKVWVKSLTNCVNTTGGETILSGNYTTAISDLNGAMTITYAGTDTAYNDTAWKCNYDYYNTSGTQWDLPNKAAIGLAEYGNWFKIIVIVGVASVVLSLIFMAFGTRGQGSEIGGSY